MNECSCNSMSLQNGKDSVVLGFLSGEMSVVLVISAVDVLWKAEESLLLLAIFSRCCAVNDNGRQIYLSLS